MTLTLLQNDLMGISNRAARIKAAKRVLEDAGSSRRSRTVKTAIAARAIDEAGDVRRRLDLFLRLFYLGLMDLWEFPLPHRSLGLQRRSHRRAAGRFKERQHRPSSLQGGA